MHCCALLSCCCVLFTDRGLSYNSSTTLGHILQSAAQSPAPPLILYTADFSYAGGLPVQACAVMHLPCLVHEAGSPCCKNEDATGHADSCSSNA